MVNWINTHLRLKILFTQHKFMLLYNYKKKRERLCLFFSTFLSPHKKEGRKKGERICKNRDQRACLSARSCFLHLFKIFNIFCRQLIVIHKLRHEILEYHFSKIILKPFFDCNLDIFLFMCHKTIFDNNKKAF